jgi:hypothetical protein
MKKWDGRDDPPATSMWLPDGLCHPSLVVVGFGHAHHQQKLGSAAADNTHGKCPQKRRPGGRLVVRVVLIDQ